jgi:hypothetical protein
MINGDLAPIAEYTDLVRELSTALQSKRFLASTVQSLQVATSAAFNTWMDAQAHHDPRHLFHVYEPWETGKPESRLWNVITTGSGDTRTVTYEFKPSRKPNLVGEELKRVGGFVPDVGLPDLRQQIHIFRWKAPILEEGQTVRVKPMEPGGVLAFPTPDGMQFAHGELVIGHKSSPTVGQFNKHWLEYWAGFAEVIEQQDIIKPMEENLTFEVERAIRSLSKSNPRGLRFGVATSGRKSQRFAATAITNTLTRKAWQAARKRVALSHG